MLTIPAGSLAAARLIAQFTSFGSWSKHTETGPKSIGIGLRRLLVTASGILGLASSGLGADFGPRIDDFRPDS